MGWVVNATPRPLYPRNDSVTLVQEAGWAPRASLEGCGISRCYCDSITGPSVYRLCYPGLQTSVLAPVIHKSCYTQLHYGYVFIIMVVGFVSFGSV